MKRRIQRMVPALVMIATWLIVTVSLVLVTPEALVEFFGIENAYLFLFVLAFVSGVSIFGGVPYHLVLLALSAGGLNPWLLGLVATVGVLLGDSTSYYVGYRGRDIVPEEYEARVRTFSHWLERYPRGTPFFFLAYGSFVPFSNDFIGIVTGLARYPFHRVMVPLGIGNLVFNTTLALLAPYLTHLLGLL